MKFLQQIWKKLNDERKLIVDDIIYKKHKYPSKVVHIFLTWGVGIGKIFTLMCSIQNMLRYYIKNISNANPLKPKIIKLMVWTFIQHLQFL